MRSRKHYKGGWKDYISPFPPAGTQGRAKDRRQEYMSIKKLTEKAANLGYSVKVDTSGRQYVFTITNTVGQLRQEIQTDRRGAEAFIIDGIDAYLDYCYSAGIDDPFSTVRCENARPGAAQETL